jgi:hypothetical protein
MLRRLTLSVTAVLALALVPVAVADGGGPSPGLMQGWTGVTGPGQPLRFVTLPTGRLTVVESIGRFSGKVVQWRTLAGTWGVPMVANDGTTGGLSRDGRMLVLADWNTARNSPLRAVSRFKLFNASNLHAWRTITLRGDFAFDALSPGGGTLYLIEHVSKSDVMRYRVRAYDIASSRLLPRVIADRRQAGWVMHGYPLERVASADGRWVYTLYQQPGGYPFVHALDAVNMTAVCIGVPWKGSQNALPTARLQLGESAGTLTLAGAGREFAIDTTTFRVSLPGPRGGGFPTALVAGPAAGLAALVLLGLALRRRLRSRLDPSIEGLSS